MLACPASFFKKDSRRAGMTVNVVLLINSLVRIQYIIKGNSESLQVNCVAGLNLFSRFGFL